MISQPRVTLLPAQTSSIEDGHACNHPKALQDIGLIINTGLSGEDLHLPIQLKIHGGETFHVWSGFDCGEKSPAWAEPDFHLDLLAPPRDGGNRPRLQQIHENGSVQATRILAEHPQAAAEIIATHLKDQAGVELQLTLSNPQSPSPEPKCNLPLSVVELTLGPFDLPDDAHYTSAHAYGGRTHGSGPVLQIDRRGLPFTHGVIGLAFPLLYLHQPGQSRAIEIEFMLDGRPTLWLRRAEDGRRFELQLVWHLDRLLLPGERHAIGGLLRIRRIDHDPITAMRQWRDRAWDRFGIQPPRIPGWARRTSTIELWLQPGAYPDFTRHDDPNLLAMLKRWRDMGYDSIMAVAPNRTGKYFLSPLDYRPREACGGIDAERTMLQWMHDLGFHAFLWITTVGLDNASLGVRQHPEWWTHRTTRDFFYAWESNRNNGYLGYAPDGDPLSAGWRECLESEVRDVMCRGWDGIYIDGCIPRASNQARHRWPGEGRNAVEEQALALQRVVDAAGEHTVTVVEDAGLGAHLTATIHTGRYTPATPFHKKAYWDHGMGGGPELAGQAPPQLKPHEVRDYLRIRYACILPGTLSMDHAEGYVCESSRPWTVQTMLAGPTCFKTHAEFVNDPLTFRQLPDAPPAEAIAHDVEHRRRGHEEFLRLLALRRDEPLIGMDTPLSIESLAITGSQAVLGLLRPTPTRCLAILLNFAPEPARVSVTLTEPVDLSASERIRAGQPHRFRWSITERLRSMVDETALPSGFLGFDQPLAMPLAACGFRVLELTHPTTPA